MTDHVAIVGGGFSGTMLAAQLIRAGLPRVTLIERKPDAGLGLAYGAADPIHLLNVRAGNMSAWADQSDHLSRWLKDRGVVDCTTAFIPRPLYGVYVQEQLADALGTGRLQVVHTDIIGLRNEEDGVTLIAASDETIAADAAVLALGNLPPPPPGIDPDALPPGTYRGDPWAPGTTDGLGADDEVAVIGTGLTMVDMVLLLEKKGFTGPILAISRRGLTPHAHAAPAPNPEPLRTPLDAAASMLVRSVRTRGEAVGWRQAIDELRPFTQTMWRNATVEQRRRFIRHLRPWWDVHRHRIAPDIHARIRAMIDRGQLRVAAGKIVSASADGDRVLLTWRPRGAADVETFTAARIINCTGPEGDLPRSTETLLRELLAAGAIRPGPCGIGIDVDEGMRVLDRDGTPSDRLYAVGPLTRGVLWEIVAVPDIRAQVHDLARRMTGTA